MASSRISAVKERAKAQWDKLSDDDLESVKEGASALASRLADRYGFDLDEARSQADRLFNSASEMAASAYDRAINGTAAATDRVDSLVRENPWRALVGAMLLGAAVGYALGSNGRRSYW